MPSISWKAFLCNDIGGTMKLNNQDIALKLVGALYLQGKINDLTFARLIKKYGFMQGGVRIELRQSA